MAYYNIDEWRPYKKTAQILERAMEHIQSVDYKVSVRWVFYRLLQDGYYNSKDDYTDLISLTSRARHAFYKGWHPTILADETREMDIHKSFGARPDPDVGTMIENAIYEAHGEIKSLQEQLDNYEYNCDYFVDPNFYQDNILIIMFEARAMFQQFKKYTKGLTLCPFGGQPSIPYKWQIAKYIEQQSEKYDKDVVVLYFGDYDSAGLKIFNTGREDISKWCRVDVEFVHCGLNEEQVTKYNIPENVDHHGFQWEALSDSQASEIITGSINQYYNHDAEQLARAEGERVCEMVETAVQENLDEGGLE